MQAFAWPTHVLAMLVNILMGCTALYQVDSFYELQDVPVLFGTDAAPEDSFGGMNHAGRVYLNRQRLPDDLRASSLLAAHCRFVVERSVLEWKAVKSAVHVGIGDSPSGSRLIRTARRVFRDTVEDFARTSAKFCSIVGEPPSGRSGWSAALNLRV